MVSLCFKLLTFTEHPLAPLCFIFLKTKANIAVPTGFFSFLFIEFSCAYLKSFFLLNSLHLHPFSEVIIERNTSHVGCCGFEIRVIIFVGLSCCIIICLSFCSLSTFLNEGSIYFLYSLNLQQLLYHFISNLVILPV